MTFASRVVAYTTTEPGVQRLRRCSFAVCQNFSNRRRKVVDAGTRHDDAVTAAVSFLSDAQESPAVVLSELDVEMLALDLQFSRLNDVIHFSLRPPSLGTARREWKKNPHPPCRFFGGPLHRLPEASGSREIAIGCGAGRPTYNFLRVFDRTAQACLSQSIPALIDRPTRSAQLFRCQSRERRDRMIRTRPSVSEISASLRPVIYFRSPAV